MSIKQSFVSKSKKRADYMTYRNSLRVVDMDAPYPDDSKNPFLDPLVPNGPKFLPFAFFNKALTFMLPEFDGQSDLPPTFYEAFLTVDNTPDDASKINGTTTIDPPPPRPMTLLSKSKDNPGLRRVSLAFEFGGNPATVKTFEYTVDPVAPLLDKSVEPPQPAGDYGLDPEDFSGGKKVLLTYAPWSNQRLGDEIKCYIGRDKNTKQEVETVKIDASNLGQPIEFSLEARHVVGFDGRYIVFCEAKSYPGVPSLPSAETVLWVFKDRKPVVVEPLNVPQIPDSTVDVIGTQELIDGLGAGLENLIPNFNSALDKIVYNIDDVDQPEKSIPGFAFLHSLDNHALVAKGHGPRTVKLGYRIKRGIFFYPKDPIVTDYLLDVLKPCGPFDPDDPDHPDESMFQPWIQGPVSSGINTLTAADKQSNLPVDGFLKFHPRAKKGDTYQFYVGGVEAPAPGGRWVFPLDGSEDPSKDIPFQFLWSFLDTLPQAGNWQLQVVATHDVNFNEAQSPVDYANISLVPIVLSAAGFKYMHTNPLVGLICSSLRKLPDNSIVLVVHIPADTRLAGNEITLKYEGYSTSTPGTPIPGSPWDDTYTPDATEAATGFDMYMPYAHMLATRNGYGRVSYEVTINGEFAQKNGDVVRVNASNGTEPCDITKPIPPV